METKDLISHWVKEARTEAGLSGAALGAKLALELGTERGHTKANISHWETGKHAPSLWQLMAISKVTGKMLPDEIVKGLNVAAPSEIPQIAGAMAVRIAEKDDPDFVQIPMVKLRLQAGVTGFQTEPERRDSGTVGMRRNWIDRSGFNPSSLIGILVKGESMEPSLYEDDIVVINTADKSPVDGAVFAVNYEGEAVVKRLSRDAGEWWLTSDNSDQRKHHRKICRGDACIIIGKVVRKESDRI